MNSPSAAVQGPLTARTFNGLATSPTLVTSPHQLHSTFPGSHVSPSMTTASSLSSLSTLPSHASMNSLTSSSSLSSISSRSSTTSSTASNSSSSLKTPNVYINGLPPNFPEEQLLEMTKPYGEVISVRTFTRHVSEKPS